MTTDRSEVALNATSRERLQALVRRCSDAQLAHPMPAGWTVAALLSHVAFWDERVRLLLERWQSDRTVPTAEDASEVDWINDSAKPMFLALPPRKAAEIAVTLADAVDRVVASLPDHVVAANAKLGGRLNLVRAQHRDMHLDEIERVLGR